MGRQRYDITNKKFGKLTAIVIDRVVANNTYWFCQCECGNTKSIKINSLTSGDSKTCGCSRKNNGRAKSPLSLVDRFNNYVLKIPFTDCHLWIGSADSSGYGSFTIDGTPVRSHQTAFTLYKGEIPQGFHVLHSCDNKICVNPDHLRLGVNAENMKDWSTRGKFKATPEIVGLIREDLSKGLTQEVIAQKYGFKRPYISKIKLNKRRMYV